MRFLRESKTFGPPAFVLAGFGTVALFISVWIAASALDGRWILGDTLSSMGTCRVEEAEMVFNYGCVLTGVLGCIFGHGIMKYNKGWLFLSGVFTFIAPIFLMGVGAINESYGDTHMTIAGLFGAFSLFAMLFSLPGDFREHKKYFNCTLTILIALGIGWIFIKGFGFFEVFSVLMINLWILLQSKKYLDLIGPISYVDPIYEKFGEIKVSDSFVKRLLRK